MTGFFCENCGDGAEGEPTRDEGYSALCTVCANQTVTCHGCGEEKERQNTASHGEDRLCTTCLPEWRAAEQQFARQQRGEAQIGRGYEPSAAPCD